MKKYVIGLVAVIIVIILFFIGYNNNIFNKKEISDLYDFKYFSPLSQNDVYYADTMEFTNGIYYKIISDYEEYLKYKENYNDIIDMDSKEFKNNFLVLTATENTSTQNLGLESIEVDESTLYIGLEKTNEKEVSDLDRGISIKIDRDLFRDNIDIFKTIENTNFMETYSDIRKIPKEYTLEEAIEDNCFVNLGVSSSNVDLIHNFLEKIESNQNAEIRIVFVGGINDNIIIYDIKYVNEDKKYYVCVDNSRVIDIDYDGNSSMNDTYNYYEFDILEKMDYTDDSIIRPLDNINTYILRNSEIPEDILSFWYFD